MDRRQRKTRRAIYGAFEQLMAKEHYQAVTVAQIIESADIGRSTFYAHFETKDDLLQEMCREMFDHIFEGVNEYCVTHADLATESLEGKLAHLLYHLRDSHSGVCGKLICEGEPIFTNYFEQQLKRLFEREGAGAKSAAVAAEAKGAEGGGKAAEAKGTEDAGEAAETRGTGGAGAKAAGKAAEGVPCDLRLVMQVSAFESAVVWWFGAGAKMAPEQVAQWVCAAVV